MKILRRGNILTVFALAIGLILSVCCSDSCKAQPVVHPADHSNFVGHTFASSPSLAIVDVLSDAGQYDAAERALQRRLNYDGNDARQFIQLNNQLLLVKAKHLLASSQAATQHVAIAGKISKTAAAVASSVESKLKDDQPVPGVSDVKLFLEFGKYRALSELARYLTAAKLATVGNKSLDAAAQNAINNEIEALNDLQNRVERRGSELTKQKNSVSRDSWINEFRRLINEIYLLKIDLLAMHMDQIPAQNEADRVSVATSLRTEIANVSAKLGSLQSDSPRLNLLRARAAASVGEIDKAIELLERVNKSVDESLREQSQLMVVDILLTQNTSESINKARAALNELLTKSSSVSPALALTVFRHNLINSSTAASSGAVSFDTPDDLARSLQSSIPMAQLTIQKESLGKRYGDYWRLRAEALMLQNAIHSSASAGSAGTELLDAQVQQDLLADRKEEAIQRLTAIEQQANDKNDINKAFATARQTNALLYKLLRNKENESGINSNTIAARLSIAQKCRDAAIKYKNQPLAHEELLQSIQIARGATSKTDANQNKQVLEFIVQTIEPNVSIFANSKSLGSIMQTIAIVLASGSDYGAVTRLWEKVAFAQSEASQGDASLVMNSRRYRAIFRTLELIAEPAKFEASSESKEADSSKAIFKDFANDDQSIRSAARSIYWSDQLVDNADNNETHQTSMVWIESLVKLRSDLEKSGKLTPSPSFDKSNSIGVYEELVYKSLRQKVLAEFFLNRKLPVPADLQLATKNDETSKDGVLKIISSGLAGCDAKSESATSILIGNAEVGLDRYKVYANAHKSPENTLWFGRLLSATTRRREAINVLTKLAKTERVATPNWFRIKADVYLALNNADQKEAALKDFENALNLAPSAPDQWKKAVKAILQ